MVGVNNPSMQATLDVGGEIRVGDSGRNPVAGMIRWNDDAQDFEGYDGSKWLSLTKSNIPGQFGKPKPSELIEDQKITASDGGTDDYFGTSVSISGDYAIIGADHDNAIQGSAYIFNRNGTSWIQQAKLTSSDGAAGDYFGASVSISGDYAVIGAKYDDIGSNPTQGSAYIFNRSGTSWIEQAKLTASDGAAGDVFGHSVSISGDYAVIGADGDDVGSNTDQGSAYIFNRSGTAWTEQAKLTASDGTDTDYFGNSVSISGDYAVIGAYNSYSTNGSAYVFKRSGTSWTQKAKLTASDGAAGDVFGRSVSISGDYAVIGASESAYIFNRSGIPWTQQAKLTAFDGVGGDGFGNSVSIFGDYAIIGAFNSYSRKGSAHIFHRSGTSWTQQANLTASDGVAFDHFGYSVSIYGDYVIIGADWDDIGSNTFQGSAYIMEKK
ncbi:MAG: FG-GAP repeat protein [Saprospiraceae bacterium]|nr:FG-GAP repeat protein [Saprospiraceae bacterium]